jgi:GTP cyclohydrolase I
MKFTDNNNVSAEFDLETIHHVKLENPLRDDAFVIDDSTKITLITNKFIEILEILGLDLSDDSLKETPQRIAKMYVKEIFSGLNPEHRPKITLFKNKYQYHTPLVEKSIPFTSFCEHHFVPIIGKAHIAYIPKKHVIGISKIHRLVDFYAKRPQVQERLTQQIAHDLQNTLHTKDVAVVLKASHTCISCRGVKDLGSETITAVFLGGLKDDNSIKSILLNN